MKRLASLLCLFAASSAEAGGCRTAYYTPYVETVYATKVYEVVQPVVALIAAFPVPVYAYGASYYGPPPAAGQPAYNDAAGAPAWAQQMLQRMDALERKVGSGSGTQRGPMDRVSPEAKGDDPAPIFAQRCAGCHESAVAGSKGGGFTLVRSDGGDVSLNGSDVLKIVSKVLKNDKCLSGRPPLPASEKSVIERWGEKSLSGASDVSVSRGIRKPLVVSLPSGNREYARTEE